LIPRGRYRRMILGHRLGDVVADQLELAVGIVVPKAILGNGAVRDILAPVDLQDFGFAQALYDVAQAQDHDLVRDDHDAPSAVMQRNGIEQRAKPEDDVDPAFSARRTMIEFSHQRAKFGLFGVKFANARRGQPIQNAKFLLAQPLVDANRSLANAAAVIPKDFRGFNGAYIGAREDDFGARRCVLGCKGSSQYLGLLAP